MKALVVIDLQNDITKHYRDIIDNVNKAIEWAQNKNMTIVYIKHNELSKGATSFQIGKRGFELVSELNVVSNNIFIKNKSNALTSADFMDFIIKYNIDEFYVVGADATACIKSTTFNMRKANYTVHVISDCVTSYALNKVDEMLEYYVSKGCDVRKLEEFINE